MGQLKKICQKHFKGNSKKEDPCKSLRALEKNLKNHSIHLQRLTAPMQLCFDRCYFFLCTTVGSAGSQLFVYIQTVQSYLAPPLTMTFVLGILWPKLTEAGALSGLVVGFLLGILKFILGNIFPAPHCGEVDDRPGFVKLHFMFYGNNIVIFPVYAALKSLKTCHFFVAVFNFRQKQCPKFFQ